MPRKLREFKIHNGSGPVVKAGTKLEAVRIYESMGIELNCSNLRVVRKGDRQKGRKKGK